MLVQRSDGFPRSDVPDWVLCRGRHPIGGSGGLSHAARARRRRDNRGVASPPTQTNASFLEELPALLQARSMSAHALAKKAGINHSHLSRAKRGKDYKSLSGELVARLGRALELPAGYFPEEREAVVFEHLRNDTQLRDELYRRLTRGSS
jgi:transcriptional regulator with XRE-family HTH domain